MRPLRGFFSPENVMTYASSKTGGPAVSASRQGDTVDVDLLDIEKGKTATFEVLCTWTARTSRMAEGKRDGRIVDQRKTRRSSRFKYKRRKVITARSVIAATDSGENQKHHRRSNQRILSMAHKKDKAR